MFSKVTFFGFVVLEDNRHFFNRHLDELVEDKTQARASLPNSDLLESLNIDIPLCGVTRSCRKDIQRMASTLEVDALV